MERVGRVPFRSRTRAQDAAKPWPASRQVELIGTPPVRVSKFAGIANTWARILETVPSSMGAVYWRNRAAWINCDWTQSGPDHLGRIVSVDPNVSASVSALTGIQSGLVGIQSGFT